MADPPIDGPEAQSAPEPRSRVPIGEDWMATIVGLVLLILVLLGVIGKGIVP
jgi:hypothetical protein